jgi:aryl-alcohol dehydrogenase-like predicted oxidoreductase
VRKRPLGKTSLDVSELGLGTWGLSGDGYGPVVAAEVDRVLDRAVDAGINVFDTADVYGRGAMEKKLGERLPKDKTFVVTKIGTDLESSPAQKRFDMSYLRVAFERSRDRLGRDPLDIVLLHNPTVHGIRATDGVLFVKELKERGKVRAWGVSCGSTEVARAAIEAGAEVVELAYNVFIASDLHELSSDITHHKVGVLARSVLAHGLLTGHWSPEREFYPGDHRADRWNTRELGIRIGQLAALRPFLNEDLPTLRAVALRFVLSNQLVSSAILGPRSVAQLDQLEREAGEPPYLKDTEMVELAARLKGAGVKV